MLIIHFLEIFMCIDDFTIYYILSFNDHCKPKKEYEDTSNHAYK